MKLTLDSEHRLKNKQKTTLERNLGTNKCFQCQLSSEVFPVEVRRGRRPGSGLGTPGLALSCTLHLRPARSTPAAARPGPSALSRPGRLLHREAELRGRPPNSEPRVAARGLPLASFHARYFAALETFRRNARLESVFF